VLPSRGRRPLIFAEMTTWLLGGWVPSRWTNCQTRLIHKVAPYERVQTVVRGIWELRVSRRFSRWKSKTMWTCQVNRPRHLVLRLSWSQGSSLLILFRAAVIAGTCDVTHGHVSISSSETVCGSIFIMVQHTLKSLQTEMANRTEFWSFLVRSLSLHGIRGIYFRTHSKRPSHRSMAVRGKFIQSGYADRSSKLFVYSPPIVVR
jgi:hypothetical protein